MADAIRHAADRKAEQIRQQAAWRRPGTQCRMAGRADQAAGGLPGRPGTRSRRQRRRPAARGRHPAVSRAGPGRRLRHHKPHHPGDTSGWPLPPGRRRPHGPRATRRQSAGPASPAARPGPHQPRDTRCPAAGPPRRQATNGYRAALPAAAPPAKPRGQPHAGSRPAGRIPVGDSRPAVLRRGQYWCDRAGPAGHAGEFRPNVGIRSSGWKQALQAFTIYFDGRIPTP